MLLELGTDQQFFQETTTRFLNEQASPEEVRSRRHDPAGFTPAYWEAGAALGWTSLLVDEARGGGRLSDHGLLDLSMVAYEFGRHAAPGPLAATNLAAAALDSAGGAAADEVLPGLIAGSTIVSWWAPWPCRADGAGMTLQVAVEGSDLVLTGKVAPVESAAQASHLVVVGHSGDGTTQVLVPTDAPGVTITPMGTLDLTKRFATVTFDRVRLPARMALGDVGRAGQQLAVQMQMALVIACAESVGAMDAGFDMTVAWSFDRRSFGRPLASYQALKHRFADMKTWLESSHGISDDAAAAVAGGSPEAEALCSAAKAYIGDYGAELMQDCVQMHGGIGVTFDHDLHLFLRRQAVDRMLLGTPADHRRHLADLADRPEPGDGQ